MKLKNLFAALNGCTGETQSSAFLAYCLEVYPELRHRILSCLWRGPFSLTEEEKISVQTEREIALGNSRGRADIWIETAAAVLCVENKHWAPFGEGQPQKYLDEVDRIAKDSSRQGRVVLLVPDARCEEARDRCKSTILNVTPWSEILKIMDRAVQDRPGDAQAILLTEFCEWMRDDGQLGSLDLLLDGARLGKWDGYHSDPHRDAANKLWRFFPNGASHPNNGNWYAGYWFGPEDRGPRPWFGFITDRCGDGPDQASLYILSTSSYSFQDQAIEPRNDFKDLRKFLECDSSEGPGYCWKIDATKLGPDGQRWADALRPLHVEVPVVHAERKK